MHIVYITKEYPPSKRSGGIGSYVQEMARAVVRLGHRATVLTASDDTNFEETTNEGGVTVMRLSKGDFWIPGVEKGSKLKKFRCVYRYHSYRKKLVELINALGDVDIVEVPEFGAEGLYLDDLNIPYVVRLHTPSFFDRNTLKRTVTPIWKFHRYLKPRDEARILSRAKYITSCSDNLYEWMKKELDISPRIIETIYNPIGNIDISNIQGNGVSEKKKFTIFFAGTLIPQKGIYELVEACRILNKSGREVKLLLAGKESPAIFQIMQHVKSANETWCKYLGKLTREEVSYNYINADVCCFPSWWDNMPMVCLESMIKGAVVIGSLSGGMPEIIKEGHNGFLVSPHDPQLIADKIAYVMDLDQSILKQIRENAKDTIHNNFSAQVISTKMLDYYNRVINDFKSPSHKKC